MYEFYKKVKRNFYLSSNRFEIGDLLAGSKLATNAKFEHSICKIMPVRQKKHRNIGV